MYFLSDKEESFLNKIKLVGMMYTQNDGEHCDSWCAYICLILNKVVKGNTYNPSHSDIFYKIRVNKREVGFNCDDENYIESLYEFLEKEIRLYKISIIN